MEIIKVMFKKAINTYRNIYTYNHAKFSTFEYFSKGKLFKLKKNDFRRIPLDRFISATSYLSAGHSHWKNVKETKIQKDSEKQKISHAIVRKIGVVIQMEGGQVDPKLNSALARVLEEGKSKDVALTTMMQAVQRAKETKVLKGPQMFVEARVFVGCSVIIESFSDKQKWYKHSLQHILKQYNGGITDGGTIRHHFDFKGVVYVSADLEKLDYDRAVEMAVEANAEEVTKQVDGDDKVFKFLCETKELHEVKKSLQAQSLKPYEARLEFLPNTFIELSSDQMQLAHQLIEELMSIDGTTNVFHNMIQAP